MSPNGEGQGITSPIPNEVPQVSDLSAAIASFERFEAGDPEIVSRMKSELLMMAGIDSEDEMIKPEWGWNFAFGRFEPAVLSGLATACGDHDKKPFNDEVIGFLNQLGIVEIFAVVNQEKSEIAAMMMNIDQKNGEKFEELISKNHGSLRCDSSGLPGYCVFESE